MKKRYYTLIGILFMGLSLFAQNEIPNADFENWTNGEPNEWFTSNVAGTVINVTQTGDAQNGASAAFGEVADVAGTPFPPTLASGVQGNGAFPITERYTTLNGHYRLNSIDGEAISVTVLILDANSAALGTGFLTLDQPTSTYTSFSVPIVYGFSGDAAFATIVFNILNLSGSLPIVGASMRLHVSVPEPLIVASNGVLEKTTSEEEGWNTYHWFIANPINNYNIALNIAPYILLDSTFVSVAGDTMPFQYYVRPERLEKGKELFLEMMDHVAFYEELLGPYPFRNEKYGVAETPFLGMEHQTIIAYGNEYKQSIYGYDLLHHHELGHGTWGLAGA